MTARTKPYRCGYPCDCLIDPKAPPQLDTCSYGGGHQSTALLVLAAREVIPTRTFLFCNVGDDSEHPGTLEYVREVAAPYAAFHGLDLQTLTRRRRDGREETLMGRLLNPLPCKRCSGTGLVNGPADDEEPTGDPEAEALAASDVRPCPECGGAGERESRSLPIPVRMSNGAPGNRSCTADFKIRVVGRWLKAHGATEDHPATVSIGISLDEIHRAHTRTKDAWERVVYPLVGVGIDTGLAMRRDDCDRTIAAEPLPPEVATQVKQAVADGRLTTPSVVRQLEQTGYAQMPIPPKSSCYFCPFHKPTAWADLARESPELFAKSCELEDTLNRRRTMLGKDPVFLTRFAIPLREAIDTDQPLLPGMDEADGACDSGYCWT
jgi:hypothetical protein